MASTCMMDRIIIIMDNGNMTKNMEKEFISSLMESIMANGRIIKWKGKGY